MNNVFSIFHDAICKASTICKTCHEYKGYLGQFIAPSLKNEKNHPENISYIFPKRFSLHFRMTADQAVK